MDVTERKLNIGWAQEEITPAEPVLIAGLFHARLSEGLRDPLTVTALVMESPHEHVIFVSCDLISISAELREEVLAELRKQTSVFDEQKLIMHATHTHTGPVITSTMGHADCLVGGKSGLNLAAMPVKEYIQFAARKIVQAIMKAWNSRQLGGISYGLGTAVVGRNRRWVDTAGQAVMYRPGAQDIQRAEAIHHTGADIYSLDPSIGMTLDHVEGYEDHSVQVLATYDAKESLTGLVVNVPCPSQESEDEFVISADWWHETRQQLRRQYGEHLFILPQCSVAGDLSPHLLYDHEAERRMLNLKNRSTREEIAQRITHAVGEILPYISLSIEWNPVLVHSVDTIHLTSVALTEADILAAEREVNTWKNEVDRLRKGLQDTGTDQGSRWYVDITYAYSLWKRNERILTKAGSVGQSSTHPTEVHVIRLGDIAFATQPFEVYLDYGLQMKVRSPAIQTFLVQLAGAGTYLPSLRSTKGGGYGSTVASNLVGPQGGQELVDYTVNKIQSFWQTDET